MSVRELLEPPGRVVQLAIEHGRDAMSFLATESGMQHWFDTDTPDGTGACVAYVDTASAWVGACSPLLDADVDTYPRELGRAARRFAEAARKHGRRACLFGSEAPDADGLSRMQIGEQPIFRPAEWLADLSRRRRLREQLRRARAKGLRVRAVSADELQDGSPLRLGVERLASDWLRSRHIEPMGFLVALEPFHCPDQHRYFVAELGGRAGRADAMHPKRSRLTLATSFAVTDAVLSVGHVVRVGLGSNAEQASWRGLATAGPVVGAVLLAWATTRTTAREQA